MSEDEIEMMRSSKDEEEWNANCDKVKAAHGGYPADWYEAIVLSGFLRETSAKWRRSFVRIFWAAISFAASMWLVKLIVHDYPTLDFWDFAGLALTIFLFVYGVLQIRAAFVEQAQ